MKLFGTKCVSILTVAKWMMLQECWRSLYAHFNVSYTMITCCCIWNYHKSKLTPAAVLFNRKKPQCFQAIFKATGESNLDQSYSDLM